MYYMMRASAPSLYKQSTDSLILANCVTIIMYFELVVRMIKHSHFACSLQPHLKEGNCVNSMEVTEHINFIL